MCVKSECEAVCLCVRVEYELRLSVCVKSEYEAVYVL